MPSLSIFSFDNSRSDISQRLNTHFAWKFVLNYSFSKISTFSKYPLFQNIQLWLQFWNRMSKKNWIWKLVSIFSTRVRMELTLKRPEIDFNIEFELGSVQTNRNWPHAQSWPCFHKNQMEHGYISLWANRNASSQHQKETPFKWFIKTTLWKCLSKVPSQMRSVMHSKVLELRLVISVQ